MLTCKAAVDFLKLTGWCFPKRDLIVASYVQPMLFISIIVGLLYQN
jgi:hypothetical protein